MPDTFEKEWIDALQLKFGDVSIIIKFPGNEAYQIFLYYFDDLPENGFTTAVTCGVSNARHPDWKLARPELMISMEGNDRAWGLGMANLAYNFFGKASFRYGDIFRMENPISDQSPMNGLLEFAPPFSTQADFTFKLSDRTICLAGMYPVYEREIEYYQQVGLKEFWHSEGFELYNPKRQIIKPLR